MGILSSMFRPRSERVYAHLAPMLAMALADGSADLEETRFIVTRLGELGISPEEFAEMLKNPPEVTIPASRAERMRALVETALVMLADGVIDPKEMRVFMTIAGIMQLTPTEVGLALGAARGLMKEFKPHMDLDDAIVSAVLAL